MNAPLTKHESNALALPEAELLKVLGTSLYPGAKDASIRLVIGYCKAAGLDPMQKPVHIVPMWDSKAGEMRDVIMPGVGLYRTQAARSGCAGISEPVFGPEETRELGGVMVSFPAWCRVTVRRRQAGGAVDEFTALEFWLENYAIKGGKEKSIAPNAMWMKRPYGQLAKCAEAQALRKAFPEVGSAPAAEEMEGKSIEGEYIDGATGEVVRQPAPPARPALESYSAEAFAKNSPTWESAVVDGRKTPEQIISTLSTRAILSEEQKKAIRAFAAAQTDASAPDEQTAGAEQ